MATNDERLTAELLAEVGWLRRLAAQLAGAHGDDIAQEVWLVATVQKPETDRSLRPWLADVVRKLAHTRFRGEARRSGHESNAALEPPRDNATPESSLEKAELLHLLGELVAQLEEPYRTTILYRYYEGLTSQQIGARLFISDGTVRWRLKHAIEELRRQLDQRVDGGRGAWVVALTSLPTPAVAIAKGASVITIFKLCGAVVVVALGGAVAVHAVRREASAEPRAPALSATALPDDRPDGTFLEKAQRAYVEGRFDDAIKLAHQAEDSGNEPDKTWRIVGASSCFLQDSAGAATAWQKVNSDGRKFIEYVCKRHDTPLPTGKPIL